MSASPFWNGGATAVAQIFTITLGGTWEADDLVVFTLTSEDGTTTQTLSVTTGSTTIATICTTVRDAFNLSTNSLFTPITATATATTVILTADTAGVPFKVNITTTEANGSAADSQTLTQAETQRNFGPNDFNTLLNWSTSAAPIPQVDTLTVGGTVETDDIFIITLTSESGQVQTLSVTAGSATIATVCTTIRDAFNNSTLTLFSRITASATATTIVLTADTAGIPFFCTVSTTEVGGGGADAQTFVRAATTANVGIPTTSDDVTIDAQGSTNAILYGLTQTSVTLASLTIRQGGPRIGSDDFALRIGYTTGDINKPAIDGSSPSVSFLNLHSGTVQTTTNVYGSGTTGMSGLPPVTLAGSHASNVLNVYGGIVGVGLTTPGQACNFPTITVSGNGPKLVLGTGADWTTLTNNGGTVTTGKAGTTLTTTAGTSTINGTGTLTTANLNGGVTYLNNRTTAATALNFNGGVVNFSQNAAAYTITTPTINDGGGTIINASAGQGTFTNKFAWGLSTKTKLQFQPS